MKIINLMTALLFLVPGLCLGQGQESRGFTIVGQLDGVPDGELYLLVVRAGSTDTIAVTDIMAGRFEFAGVVREPQMGNISIPGMGAIPVVIENADITVRLGADGLKVSGGPDQELLNRFGDINAAMRQKQSEFELQLQQALIDIDQAKTDEIHRQIEEFREQLAALTNALIAGNPDSFVPAYIIASSMQNMQPEVLKRQYALLGDGAKASAFGQFAGEYIAALEKLEIGAVAPDFVLPSPKGESVSLHGVKARVKLIDFWASWCGPCRQENPNIARIYKKYRPKGLEIIGVSLDTDAKKWKEAISYDRIQWIQVSDLKGGDSEIVRTYIVKAIPHTILLDEDNRIVAKDLRGEELEARIRELLD